MNYYIIDLLKLIEILRSVIVTGTLQVNLLEIITTKDDCAPEKQFAADTAPLVFARVMEAYLNLTQLNNGVSINDLTLIFTQFREKCIAKQYEPTLEDLIIIIGWITAKYADNLSEYCKIVTPKVFTVKHMDSKIDELWIRLEQLKTK
ncbi:hypothetical protein KBC03_02370 [Patescibacteria group bacterium]|nr:hypothetical protein [Patescibacteria group bacterium]